MMKRIVMIALCVISLTIFQTASADMDRDHEKTKPAPEKSKWLKEQNVENMRVHNKLSDLKESTCYGSDKKVHSVLVENQYKNDDFAKNMITLLGLNEVQTEKMYAYQDLLNGSNIPENSPVLFEDVAKADRWIAEKNVEKAKWLSQMLDLDEWQRNTAYAYYNLKMIQEMDFLSSIAEDEKLDWCISEYNEVNGTRKCNHHKGKIEKIKNSIKPENFFEVEYKDAQYGENQIIEMKEKFEEKNKEG